MTRITAELLFHAFDVAKKTARQPEFGDDSAYHEAEVEKLLGQCAFVDGVVNFGAVAYHLDHMVNSRPTNYVLAEKNGWPKLPKSVKKVGALLVTKTPKRGLRRLVAWAKGEDLEDTWVWIEQ